PIVTRGPTENVNDLLYLKGVDVAVINSDSLEEYKSQVPEIQQRITSLLTLFPSELHIFVRPEIKTLADLAGKKVNFNTQGTAAAYSGPLIFSRLGVDVDKTFIPHPAALEQLKRGEIAAVVFVTSKPVDAFAKGKWDEGFKFLSVDYGPKFEDYYLPSYLDSADYPNLIAKDQRIATIAVPTLLATFNWQPDSPRYRRCARFVDQLFSRMDKLRSPGFDVKWKDVDPTARAPGLERFRAAQEWLDRKSPPNQSSTKQDGHL
ncbi:TAXI family TRAP transporter solute-binding subunit, partial [Bradyrhizobium sp.]|uniref:TAXI family TRAP transporter solute-binding subunit n=1 Tax=Bradyrhizobium sp. TaxID=376 RepID=UPI003C5F6EB7